MDNYYIFIVTDQTKYGKSRFASETYSFLMEKKAWGFGKNTSHRRKLKSDDRIIFYQAGGEGQKFLGTAILASGAYKDASSKDLFLDPETYKIDLKNIIIWEKPKPIIQLIENLSFIKNKKIWGAYFQGGCRKINKDDFKKIAKAKTPKTVLKTTSKLNYWVVRMGRGGKHVSKVLERKIIALGWNELSKSLANFKNFDELRDAVQKTYPKGAVAQTVGQLWRFLKEMKKGDLVLIPVPFERKIIIGEVINDYYFKKERSFNYSHRRDIKILKTIDRDECSQQLKFSLGGLLTVFSVSDHEEEIRAIVEGTPISELEKTHKTIYDAVINRLFELEAREFEKFIHHILNLVGFEAAMTSYVGDKGIDVIGNLNAEGLAQIKLNVQVKRVHSSLGIGEILRMRGTLAPDENGCIITLSGFTKSAVEDAEDERKKPIALIDGKALVDLILKHYEGLAEEYKKIIGVKQRKITLSERFIF